MKTRSLLPRLILTSSLIFFIVVAHAATVHIGQILKNPAQFDNKVVTIQGTATTVRERISRAGNPYMTSRLQDPTGSIVVYTRGHPGISNGDRVEVVGLFQQVKHVGRYTFYNEIDVQNIKRLSPVGCLRRFLLSDHAVALARGVKKATALLPRLLITI